MKRTTRREIRSYLEDATATDCTNWTTEDYDFGRACEGGFTELCRSRGIYGTNGIVVQGRRTGNLYVVTARSSAIYLFAC